MSEPQCVHKYGEKKQRWVKIWTCPLLSVSPLSQCSALISTLIAFWL